MRHLLPARVGTVDGFFRLTAGLCRIGVNEYRHIAFRHPIVVPFPRKRSFGKVFRNAPYRERPEYVFFVVQEPDTFIRNGERSLLDDFDSIIGKIAVARTDIDNRFRLRTSGDAADNRHCLIK